MSIKGYRCPNCNSMIHISNSRILRCECCGSEFERTDDYIKPLKVEVCEVPIVTLGTCVSIPAFELRTRPDARDYIIGSTVERISRELADQIIPFIQFQNEHDVMNDQYRLYGRVKIADPGSARRSLSELF